MDESVTGGSRFHIFVRLGSHIMRGAFVVQLGPETKPSEDKFEGWIIEVDSCTELRFRSGEELLKFLGQRFDLMSSSLGNEQT